MKENGRLVNRMVKEHSLSMMGKSMKGNSRMIKNMVKEHSLLPMDISM